MSTKKNNVLIIDDDIGLMQAMEIVLDSYGIGLSKYTEPITALQELKTNKHDVLVVNYLMPMIRGDEIVRLVREFDKEIYKEDYKEIVSKKESKNLKNKKDLQSYEEIFEDFGVGKILKEAYFRFIAHLKVNHNVVMLNERLQTLIVRMDFSYKEDCDKIRALDEAIAKNYKRLECESA